MIRKLMEIGDTFHDCLTIVDVRTSGRPCLYVNQKFEENTGYKKEEAVGRNLSFLQGLETDIRTTEFMRERFQSKEACIQDILNYKKDGTKFINRLLLIPFESDKEFVYVGFQNDITDLKTRLNNLDLRKVQSSEICHNINNHLFILLTQFAKIFKDPNMVSHENIQVIASRLKQLNDFSLSIDKVSEFEKFKYR